MALQHHGNNFCESSLSTAFTPNNTPALPKIPAITNAVVLSAPPAVGHSINPTSSAAPANMFAPSSAFASFAARIAAPMSSLVAAPSLSAAARPSSSPSSFVVVVV